ncbi:FAD-dependent oxidoreductase [Asticcacaulis sp. SL142]|uniref:NAD(P)/FAD-dependent oxidoreductase n=1 Tax=Asticcacaulis sp. SL142 TaxID=2995155 RepID=UPI00226C7C2A|nr:FAD-dependent oxidoreductase [Asticcacaulis sp. SL142]WAC48476.1 FAD-dependent oxidoreductase [Asticcacaulis sp. SL142]
MTASPYSVIIIGGGIVGLCVGLRALDLGLSATIVAKDDVMATTSAMSAGMVAPTLEAMTEADPHLSFARYATAQKSWTAFADGIGLTAVLEMAQPGIWLWEPGPTADDMLKRFTDMGARAKLMTDASLGAIGYDAPFLGIEISGDWVISPEPVLAYLKNLFLERGGQWREGNVLKVTAHEVVLAGDEHLSAGHVVVCAGFGSARFSTDVPSLSTLSPIKGHLLDMARKSDSALAGRMVRSPWGYFVFYDGLSKFGATMQTGRSDLDIEDNAVASLKDKSLKFTSGLMAAIDDDAVARVGVRAASPDHWPLIGQDAASGVWVATGMRRNGWIYGPYAAEAIIAGLTGVTLPDDAGLYDPNRFN